MLYLTSFDKISNLILNYTDIKIEKRGIRSESTSSL